jgi:rhamnosyltransferase subunit B
MGRWMHSPQGVLGLFPDWFAPPQSDWPSGVKLTGFPLFDEAPFHRLDADLDEFLAQGDPPVVFTPGSTLVNESAYRHAATEALDALGCRGIFLGGQGATLPTSKSTIMARSYVPLSKLLPRVRALVHHGGIGTVSQAFAAGIAQLITPFAHDQFDNAARVERLGCGIQSAKGGGAQSFLAPLRRLLEDDSIQHNCSAIRSRVESGEASRQNALIALETIAAGSLRPSRPDPSWQRQPRLTSA